MDPDAGTAVTVVAALAVVAGVVGVVVPLLPGLALAWAGVAAWAFLGDAGPGRWVVLGVATALAVAGTVVKWVVPGRDLKRSGLPNGSLAVGGVLGAIGFFVIPVVGLVVGLVVGVWIAEQVRLGDRSAAWRSTMAAVRAVGLSMAIELAAGLGIAVAFVAGLAFA